MTAHASRRQATQRWRLAPRARLFDLRGAHVSGGCAHASCGTVAANSASAHTRADAMASIDLVVRALPSSTAGAAASTASSKRSRRRRAPAASSRRALEACDALSQPSPPPPASVIT
jgi:hypothetical protein